ncbi:MAG: hypothetical protein AAF202_09555, partial [Pseudomonadota bacterium]
MVKAERNWIVSANFDINLFILPVLLSLSAVLILYENLVSAALLWWGYTILFDVPHLYFTHIRTFFDPEEREFFGPMIRRSFLWFLVGPACGLAAHSLADDLPVELFFVGVITYGYFHILRQHYGFLAIYQGKNKEPAGSKNPVEYWLFHAVMALPFPVHILKNQDLQNRL